ncbi:S1 family peptidase [Cohnella ginsengisoli]|uniref:S1 family peptidase n=1 Tax=Cohnella ginsengisoli TaxID=425004 RepID=A0A9X4KHT6_9BACL|nr:S1 family peptidase [Cohnella ginsengisoli]MDG0792235.1 S1 family peptidase [Cohnella ginsengisoli]
MSRTKKVEVNLERETQARGNTIEALFDTSEIDQSVVDVNYDVVIDAEPALARTANFTTMGGGIAIDNSNCSTAFTATKDTKEFLVTAGHCVTSIGSAAKQNTTNVGTQHLSAYGDYGTDVGLILLTDTSRSIGNGYYYNGLANGEYDKNYTTTTTVINGQLICKSGIKTSVTCGSVTNTSATVTYGTIHLTGMIQAKKDDGGLVLGGDSGGVVFNPYNYGQLIGIVSGRSLATSTLPEGYYGYFTKVGNALANGGAVTLYTSSSTKAVNPNS